MLNLNWTLIAQLVMFLVAMFFLSRFLFRPMVAVFKKREEKTDKPFEDAAKLKEDAAEARETVEQKLLQVRKGTDELRGEILGKAKQEEQEYLDDAREKAENRLREAREKLAAKISESRERLTAEADQLAEKLAGKLLEIKQ